MSGEGYEALRSLFEQDVALRLVLASLLGAAIGLERERAQKAAGLRTNMLICLGAALVMEVSTELAEAWGRPVDPSRMAGEVVSGIGFIGAGAILVTRGRIVVGLTTAATIWVVAAVGLAVGAGAYTHAVTTTLLLVVVLAVLGWFERVIFEEAKAETIEIDVRAEEASLERVKNVLRDARLESRLTSIEKASNGIHVVAELRGGETARHATMERLADLPVVRSVRLAAVRRENAG